MDPKLHFIIASEQGQAKSFVISKGLLKNSLLTLLVVFLVSTAAGIKYSIENFSLKNNINDLQENVSTLNTENKHFQDQVHFLEEKNKAQLTGAYGELNQRSQVIDSILSTLDIVPASDEPSKAGEDSGGPFTSVLDKSCETLIMKVDHDIKTIRPLPLGYPIQAKRMSSGYGRRADPLNGETAYHDGVDLSGERGTEVRATADGLVIERGYNPTYGWYVKIDHGNRFSTMYAHNQKILVRKNDFIERGQVVSLVGNTGRSTGPHLHYEIRYNDQPVNPMKFMNINRLISLKVG
ncbi:MAG: M23 family metallopeptidase [Proteobacteria bacterium]|nr:M23 family metallopeptidase [Pseudomonadota bacterium]MBU1738699.1 M23 family metallopeptidase [Pseudomonadota bacterium]